MSYQILLFAAVKVIEYVVIVLTQTANSIAAFTHF